MFFESSMCIVTARLLLGTSDHQLVRSGVCKWLPPGRVLQRRGAQRQQSLKAESQGTAQGRVVCRVARRGRNRPASGGHTRVQRAAAGQTSMRGMQPCLLQSLPHVTAVRDAEAAYSAWRTTRGYEMKIQQLSCECYGGQERVVARCDARFRQSRWPRETRRVSA
eukprot:2708463-Pleurochrysis_carterae.AAC.2